MTEQEQKLQEKKIEWLEKIYKRLGTLLVVVFFLLLSVASSLLIIVLRKTF